MLKNLVYSHNKAMKNPSAYLERIHYSGPLQPDVETLRGLHRAHLVAVPFENLDIGLGRAIRLDEDALFEKIVRQRRGGFCYELNGLFARLLEGLGYQVTLLNARGVNDDGSYSMEFDHLALLVRCPGEPETGWLADVGWGNGPLEPLRLAPDSEQTQGDRVFNLVPQDNYLVLIERVPRDDGSMHWIKHYAFTLQPHAYADFFPACRYHSTSSELIFTKKRICTRYTADGRVSLSEQRLIITRGTDREERPLGGEAEVRQVLKQYFDIDL